MKYLSGLTFFFPLIPQSLNCCDPCLFAELAGGNRVFCLEAHLDDTGLAAIISAHIDIESPSWHSVIVCVTCDKHRSLSAVIRGMYIGHSVYKCEQERHLLL